VDDDHRVRKSLCWLVGTLDVPVKTFPSAELFLKERDAQIPGCLIVDIKMSGMGGLDLQRELRCRGDEIPVIVLTGHGSVPVVVEALKLGATEFLQKPVDGEVMLAAVQQALAFDARRRSEGHKHRDLCERMARLTAREREVLRHVVNGLSSKEIAAQLSVSHNNVEAHRAKIMQKMEVESVAQLVGTVISGGIMP
jgi:FixJ family two-component response regulator